jgi:peptidoglycan/xylan/chitin deacetylase (PgdA/CDA1 family)
MKPDHGYTWPTARLPKWQGVSARRWAWIALTTLSVSPGTAALAGNGTAGGRLTRVVHHHDGADSCEIRNSVLIHGRRLSRDIALTFDACPTSSTPGFSAAIVDSLVGEQTPATFFVSGRWAQAHPLALERLAAVPFFEIALHGYRHHRLISASDAAIVAEIEDGRDALLRLGVHPQMLFRPPFGDRPLRLAAAARRTGVIPVTWDVAPGDPVPTETAARLERDVLRQARGGSIIVLHVNGRGVGTAAAVPALVTQLRERGFRFVTVSDLVRACAAPDLSILVQ